jgi:hypothetical protein
VRDVGRGTASASVGPVLDVVDDEARGVEELDDAQRRRGLARAAAGRVGEPSDRNAPALPAAREELVQRIVDGSTERRGDVGIDIRPEESAELRDGKRRRPGICRVDGRATIARWTG